MVTVKMGDGLGNQLYRYACGYAVARHDNDELCLDIGDFNTDNYRSYQLDKFNIDYCKYTHYHNKSFIGKICRRIHRTLFNRVIYEDASDREKTIRAALSPKHIRNKYLFGYWGWIDFFTMYEEDLRRQLTPKYPLSSAVRKSIDEFRTSRTCAVHVRLGDQIFDDSDYFVRAIRKMQELVPEVRFIIFSNDKKRTETIFNSINVDYEFGNENCGDEVISDVDEFFMISACQNQILSVGTYGIWAALLNSNRQKHVISPCASLSGISSPKEWIYL